MLKARVGGEGAQDYELKTALVDPVALLLLKDNVTIALPLPSLPRSSPCVASLTCKIYVEQMTRGGLNTASFKGIKRGEVLKADHSGIKQHKYMEIYIDPTMTPNHGNQTLRDSDHPQAVIELEEEYEINIPVPKYKISEHPSYIAWKDSTGFIYKRTLFKSGDWC